MLLTLKSRYFVDHFTKIKDSFAGKEIKGRIVVPPELRWWYFQEFGTATHLTVGVPAVNTENLKITAVAPSTKPGGYGIDPVNGSWLSWPTTSVEGFTQNGRRFVRRVLHHPGVRPRGFVRQSLRYITLQSKRLLVLAMLNSGFNYEAVHSTMIQEVMPAVVKMIAVSMDTTGVDGTRSDGKLSGKSASEAFREGATVFDMSRT